LKKIQLIISALVFGLTLNAQTYKSANWSANVFLGTSNMMGDLGGSNFIGSEGVFDLDFKSFRPAIGLGTGVHTGAFSWGANILFTQLVGNDEYTTHEFQSTRNLSVRTDLFEVNLLAEFRPFSRSAGFNRFYIYTGVGGMYYQPKAEYNDEWIKLRPLGTEGQLFLDDKEIYSELDFVIPYGLGYKFRLAKSTSLVLDLGFRKTFTDYLDDVSTVYSDPLLLEQNGGELASVLADRSLNGRVIGTERGNPEKNDSYFILGLKFELILGGNSGDGCYYNRNPKKSKSTRYNQKKMFTR